MSSSADAETVWVVGAAIIQADRCLVARRGPGMRLAGRWEFPGGKVEPGEDPRAALAREIREELGLVIEVQAWLGRGEVPLAGALRVSLDVYAARWRSGELVPVEHDEIRWCRAGELDAFDWAEADVPIVPEVVRRLEADENQGCGS